MGRVAPAPIERAASDFPRFGRFRDVAVGMALGPPTVDALARGLR